MGFRFYRRVHLGNGFGLNVSKSGVGTSMRTKHGSIGSTGFSFRTGIPGLSYRQSWGKGGAGALIFLAVMAIVAVIAALAVVTMRLLVLLAVFLWQGIQWCILTAHDYIEYRRTGQQQAPRLVKQDAGPGVLIDERQEKTLAEIVEERARNGSSK